MKAALLVLVLSFPSSWCLAVEEAERERLHAELSQALSGLAEAQARLSELAGTAQLAVPPAVPTQIATRRTLAAEWLRRIGTPTNEFPLEEAEAFRDGLHALRDRLDQAAAWSETLATLKDRWQGVATSKEFERYRVFVRGAIDQRFAEIGTGVESTVDEDLLYRRQHRHEVVLNLVEAEAQVAERLAKLPQDLPLVREFREHRAALRAAAEAGLQAAEPNDERAFDQAQQILWLLDELVAVTQERDERLAGRERPPGAAVMAAIASCQQADEQALRAMIAHVRAQTVDDPAWHRRFEALGAEREHRRRLTGMVADWLNQDDSIQEVRQRFRERLAESPAALQEPATKRAAGLEATYGEATRALRQALDGGDRIEALRAKATLRLVWHDHEVLVQDLEFQRDRLGQEDDIRSRVGEAAAPGVKQQLEASWAALVAARARQQEAERAVMAAELARELAEVAADEARSASDRARQETDLARERLDQRREQLVDALENPPPKPEGDPKF